VQTPSGARIGKPGKKYYLSSMPVPQKYLADFEEGCIYHIYNRTNNNEKLFLSDDNRVFFLKRYKELLSPFTDTYCWCLLPNHFHLLIKVKSEDTIITYLQSKPKAELTITEKKFLAQKVANFSKVGNPDQQSVITLSQLLEQTFKRFFQSYALAFNKQHSRQGNLFYKPFKRVLIEKDTQFTMAIIYIHANAAKHKLVKDFTTYAWSSWHSIISNQPTLLLRDELLDWFGNVEIIIKIHKEQAEYYYDCDVAIED
jgi:putative transposase